MPIKLHTTIFTPIGIDGHRLLLPDHIAKSQNLIIARRKRLDKGAGIRKILELNGLS
jgi:hypothetical protein